MFRQKNNLAFIVSAPSGAGKTTIIKSLLSEDDKCEFVISSTSRRARNCEIEGQSYYFIPEEEFKQKIDKNEFIEWSQVHGNYYGITKKEFDRIISIGKIPLFDVDVQGARKLKKIFREAVYIFIVPPSIEELKKRLINRNTDKVEEVDLRIHNAVKELQELNHYDYIIVNDNVTEALLDFKAIIRAELCKVKSQDLKF